MKNEAVKTLSRYYPNMIEVSHPETEAELCIWFKVDYADPSVGIFSDSVGEYDVTDLDGNNVEKDLTEDQLAEIVEQAESYLDGCRRSPY